MSRSARIHPARARQRGVATLVVVSVLFFVLALVAGYTNRSLLFEQRTSANQYRALQASEAAEAGVAWTLSMLNAGRIDDDCQPTADTTQPTFRDRYLDITPATGVAVPTGFLSGDGGNRVWPTCVFDGADWDCRCPPAPPPATSPAPVPLPPPTVGAPPAPGGAGIFPAFRIRLVNNGGTTPGTVRLEVNGCTRLSDECLDFPAEGIAGEGRATHRVLLALRGGLAAPPIAAITVQGALDAGGAALGAFNEDADTGGVTVLAGGAVTGTALRLGSVPGSPLDGVIASDAALAALPDAERLFGSTFALPSASYRVQPGVVVIDCTGAPCSADRIRGVAQRHPGHVIWADGDVGLEADVGDPDQPVLLVVTGDTSLDTGATLHGLIYGREGGNWSGGGTIRGATISEGDYAGTASYTVVYDPEVLRRLRWRTGSFVPVPGGWRDY
jgi:hypothetical protein